MEAMGVRRKSATQRRSGGWRRVQQGVQTGVICLVAAALLSACNFGQAPEPTPPPFVLATPGLARAGVSALYTVARGPVVDVATYPAQVGLASVQDLYFGTTGRVQAIYVASGDVVSKTTLIAELDTRNLKLDLEKAQVALDLAKQRQAKAEVDFNFTELDRKIDLQVEQLKLDQLKGQPTPDANAVAIQELAVRQADLAVQQLDGGMGPELQAAVDAAQLDLEKVQNAVEDAHLVAPIAGQVLLFDALRTGKVVEAYAPVASIIDPNKIVVEANLVPADLAALHEGMAVTIRTTGALTKEIPGVIQTLPQPFGSGATNTTLIAPQGAGANAANGASALRPGTNVEVIVERGQTKDALWLPPAAIQGYKDNYFVRLRDGTELPIKVGIFGDERVEVVSGVTEGMEVVGK